MQVHVQDEVVATSAGRVRGRRTDTGTTRFLGVPFAAPPVGRRRWAPPEPVPRWSGTRDALRPAPAAWQATGGPLDGLVPGQDVGPQGDDALALNVWTPAVDDGHRPVLVWVHGGGFSIGSPSLPAYDGSRLAAEHDVVVVAIGYRVGALGFLLLDDPSAAPNVGLLDQVAALRWVHDEIARFGGDPGNVTVFGESAGGGSVLSLLSMPLARGLFHRAIVQSGATDLLLDRARAEEVAATFAAHAGVPVGDVEALRDLPAEAVLEAQAATGAALFGTVGTMPFHPCVDGEVLPVTWEEGVGDAHTPVPLVLGTTLDEMGLFAGLDPKALDLEPDALARRLARIGLDPATALDAYAACGLTRPAEVWRRAQSDEQMWVPALRILERRSPVAPTWAYRFDWPAADPRLGAAHGVDIPFPFGTTHGWNGFLADPPGAARLSATTRALWASFARHGRPTPAEGATGLDWPAYDPERRATLVLDAEPHVVDDPNRPARELWASTARP